MHKKNIFILLLSLILLLTLCLSAEDKSEDIETGKKEQSPNPQDDQHAAKFRFEPFHTVDDSETRTLTFSATGKAVVASSSFNFNDNFALNNSINYTDKTIEAMNGKPSITERSYSSATGILGPFANKTYTFVHLFYPGKRKQKGTFPQFPGAVLIIVDPQSLFTITRESTINELRLTWKGKKKEKFVIFKTTDKVPLKKKKGSIPKKLNASIALLHDGVITNILGTVDFPDAIRENKLDILDNLSGLLPQTTIPKVGDSWDADDKTFVSFTKLIIGAGTNPSWKNSKNVINSYLGSLKCTLTKYENRNGIIYAHIALAGKINATQEETSEFSVVRTFNSGISGSMTYSITHTRVTEFILTEANFPYTASGQGSAGGSVSLSMNFASSVDQNAAQDKQITDIEPYQ